MVNEKFRKALDKFCEENEVEITFFDGPSFDNSIIGITTDYRLVYDYHLMVEEMSEEDGIDATEAEDAIGYNTIRALPYYGDRAPIVIEMPKDELMEKYGN